ncbi:MAG: ATP-binding protein [Myxococcota bacterium]
MQERRDTAQPEPAGTDSDGDATSKCAALLRSADVHERLEALGDLAGGLPVGMYVFGEGSDASGEGWAYLRASPLARLIDGANPADRPCETAMRSLCREAAVRGLPASAPCPSRDWRMEAWPVTVPDGDDDKVIGCIAAARPSSGPRLSEPLLAARFHLEPESLAGMRPALPGDDDEPRARLAHRELAREARALAERARLLCLEDPAPRPRGRSPRVLRKTEPHRVAGPGTLQPLLDAMALEAVWIVDADGVVRQANRTCLAWFGADVVGRRCDETCGVDRPPCPLCPGLQEVADAGEPDTVQRHELDRAGRRLDVTVYPIYLERDDRPGSLLVARDVTQQMLLDKRLQERAAELTGRRRQLELILDCMGEGLLVTDAEGRIVLSNPIARILFGMTPSELEGRHLADLFPGTLRFAQAWDDLLRGREQRIQEEVRITGVRVTDLLLTVARMADTERTADGYVATMKDITRLVELDRLRDDFVSNVSHELRTPLATVRGFARTLRREPDIPPEQRDEFLGLIDGEAERLGRLIEDMLAMARLEGSGARLRTQATDIRTLAGELIDHFRSACESEEITLDAEAPDDPAMVTADPRLLRQLGHNLVGNALKFTPRGGHIDLVVEREGRDVVLRVRDDGPGIPEEEQPRIFEKFYRAPHAKRAIPGTGLGLAIVKRIVDAHGWRVGLRSKPGQGTEVWIRMRAAPSD